MFPGNTDRKELSKALALSQVGMEMVTPIALGLVIDYYLALNSPWAFLGAERFITMTKQAGATVRPVPRE